jgi:hypothetical protein
MKQIKVNVFNFSELQETVGEKVLEDNRHIHVDDQCWYEGVFEDFRLFCETIGIEVDEDKTFFRGFYSQGDGSSFSAGVDLMALITGILGDKWKEHAPKEEPNLYPCDVHPLVISLLQKGIIDHSVRIENSRNCYSVKADADFNFTYNQCKGYPNIAGQLERLESWIYTTANKLNRFLYILLQREYEYQTSDEAIKETLISNDYLFTADGRKADSLNALAIA